MNLKELKQYSNIKVLFRGKSGRGKTRLAVYVALGVADAGGDVLYIDTEAEGATTMVSFIESGKYPEEAVETLEYVRADNYEDFASNITQEVQSDYDLVVVDTLDHKHSYVLKHVTDSKLESEADWNEYPMIYSKEKQIMEELAQPKSNIVATLDPDSGSNQKPKGAQTNIHGYFSAVIDLTKSGSDFDHVIRNWVGKGHAIGNSASNLEETLVDEILERVA